MIDSETLAGRLAHYSQNLSYTNISPVVIHEVKRRLIDTFACALGVGKVRRFKLHEKSRKAFHTRRCSFDVERGGLCERGPKRSFCGKAGTSWHDRSGPYF